MPAKEDPEHPSVDPVMDWDERFKEIYEDTKAYTMTSKERMYALYNAVTYIVENDIPGDLVECGVWRAGSTMLIARTLRALDDQDRKIYLYDTFEGMAKPTEEDYQVTQESHRALDRWEQEQAKSQYDWCLATLDEVKENMTSTGYPEEKIVYVKGKVEETLAETKPERIALLRLDTDWYESTKRELEQLYPRVTRNGVLIIDDYGYWAGAKKATDDYLADKRILLHRIDFTGRIGVKTD